MIFLPKSSFKLHEAVTEHVGKAAIGVKENKKQREDDQCLCLLE